MKTDGFLCWRRVGDVDDFDARVTPQDFALLPLAYRATYPARGIVVAALASAHLSSGGCKRHVAHPPLSTRHGAEAMIEPVCRHVGRHITASCSAGCTLEPLSGASAAAPAAAGSGRYEGEAAGAEKQLLIRVVAAMRCCYGCGHPWLHFGTEKRCYSGRGQLTMRVGAERCVTRLAAASRAPCWRRGFGF